jgi:uncharacterized protein (UPF0335 family)
MTDTNVSPVPEKYPNRYRKGDGRKRKPVGATAKYTRVIKEALLIAAEEHGRNGNGKDKLIGFMRKVIDEDLKTFCMMMARAMTLQVENRTVETQKDTVYCTVEEVQRELASRGIDMDIMMRFARLEEDDDDNGRATAGQDGIWPT